MNWVLRKYIGRFCHVYIDDILVWSQSIAERRHHMSLICQALREHGVVLSKSKSIPATDKVEFLGFMISHGSIEVTPEKVEKIIGSHIPRNPREVREFHGLVNYIGQFIPGLSHWSTILSHLTKKNVVFHWGKEQQEAFDNIKRLTRNTPICKPIDPDSSDLLCLLQTLVIVPSEDTSAKEVTTKLCDLSDFTPAPSTTPRRTTHDKEMLAIVDTAKKFSHQLLDRRFEALADHAPLVYLLENTEGIVTPPDPLERDHVTI